MENKTENKTLRSILIGVVMFVLVVCAFGGGIAATNLIPSLRIPQTASPSITNSDQTSSTDLNTLFAPFWQAWELVHQNYLVQPLDDTALMQGAIRGMMQALGDQHSSYMDPQEFSDATTDMQGSYAGIGAYVDTEAKYLTIVRPMPGSPAEAAGLVAGDQVIAIDGLDVTSLDAASVRLKVLGEAGTDVVLTILRGEQEPFDVSITRAVITIPSVESKMLDNNIAYIKISVFGDSTSRDFRDQLSTLMAQNPDGLILDLRDNTGGYLNTAIDVASQLIPSGTIVIERYGDGTQTPYEATGNGIATDVPLVVLVNGYSASASEIVAGAVQDSGRGKLVGVTTYGKGSVQNWIPLDNNQGAVRITIAEWLTPNGRTIHKIGLTPDVVVEMTADDYAAGLDPQLAAAVHVFLPELAAESGIVPTDQGTPPSTDQGTTTPPITQATTVTPLAIHTWAMNDTYAGLAFEYYGSQQEPYWRLIYEHNQAIIGDNPNDIRVGLEIEIPQLPDSLKK
jgi:carboxyl-terminal processing protease